MRAKIIFPCVLLLGATFCAAARPVAQQKKDYLSETEADKIRDAYATGPRILLYAQYAGDRIKKIKYELAHIDTADQKRTERLNSLIVAYSGCIDDAADLVEIGTEKQEDIREGVKELQAQIKEALPYLKDLAVNGAERETYKENLEDAIEATEDAAKDVEKAVKENAPPPVRRKPT
jgi:chromosome segregation ATPase